MNDLDHKQWQKISNIKFIESIIWIQFLEEISAETSEKQIWGICFAKSLSTVFSHYKHKKLLFLIQGKFKNEQI